MVKLPTIIAKSIKGKRFVVDWVNPLLLRLS